MKKKRKDPNERKVFRCGCFHHETMDKEIVKTGKRKGGVAN